MPRSLASPSALDDLLARLQRVSPESQRQWGTMSSHEMICHLGDSFRAVTGERSAAMVAASPLKRRVMRFAALHLPLRWPPGIPTMAEVDPRRQGTRPVEFEADRQALVTLARRFVAEDARYTRHPLFGEMPRRDWLIWGYRHVDHHLRQFGV